MRASGSFIALASVVVLSASARGASPEPPVFEEIDGVVAVEVESHPATDDWKAETELAGFTGRCYYTWRGGNLYRRPGKGLLTYRLRIFQPGTYRLRIRNRHDLPNSTDANDCWVRLDGGKWIKAYSGTRGRWTWATNLEHIQPRRDARGRYREEIVKEVAAFHLSRGMHAFEIAGRSRLLSIDRLHLCLEDIAAEPLDTKRPETRGIPPMPALENEELAAHWQAGRLGKALAAARAGHARSVLTGYADARLAALAALKARDPIAAVEALEALAARYDGSSVGERLAGTARTWGGERATADARAADALLAEIRKTAVPLRAVANVRDALARIPAL
ncbi:MAG: hypothetical protein ACYS5V_17670, partial [Planctomycetota bacterium]